MKTILLEALSALEGGGQTYLLNLFKNIPDHWRGSFKIFVLVSPQFAGQIPHHSCLEVIAPSFPSKSIINRFLWLHFELPNLVNRLKPDVLFCPGGFLLNNTPNRIYKTALTFQNMLPFDLESRKQYPLGYFRFRMWLLKRLMGRSLRGADLTIFISEWSKQLLDDLIGARKGMSVVVNHGFNDLFRCPSNITPDNLRGMKYVLYVSKLDCYKAQLEVVEAWHKVVKKRPTPEKLLLVGSEFKPYGDRVRALIKKLGLTDSIEIVGPVAHDELPAYYQNAQINLFASSCEIGGSFILLEALAAGRPVLCSNYPPMPEFGGAAVEYFDPYKPDELANLLLKYLDDGELCASMGKKAFEHSFKYDWKESAAKTWNALAELAQS